MLVSCFSINGRTITKSSSKQAWSIRKKFLNAAKLLHERIVHAKEGISCYIWFYPNLSVSPSLFAVSSTKNIKLKQAWSGNSPCVPLHHGCHVAGWRMLRFDAWTQELANNLELANTCWPTKICRVKAALSMAQKASKRKQLLEN